MRASVKGMPIIANASGQDAKRLEMLYELPLQLAEEQDLDALFSLILIRMQELIPGAVRGALLILEHDTGKLALRASIPDDVPLFIPRCRLIGQGVQTFPELKVPSPFEAPAHRRPDGSPSPI